MASVVMQKPAQPAASPSHRLHALARPTTPCAPAHLRRCARRMATLAWAATRPMLRSMAARRRPRDPEHVAPFDPDGRLLRVVIDTPRGSRNKYRFDPELARFSLRKVLPVGA